MSSVSQVFVLLLTVTSSGCGPGPRATAGSSETTELTSGSSFAETATSDTTTSGQAEDPCELAATIEEYDCQLPLLCGGGVSIQTPCSHGPFQVMGDWECFLDVLANDTVGQLIFLTEISDEFAPSPCHLIETIYVLGDGTVVVEIRHIGTTEGDTVRRVNLHPREYYEECASRGDDEENVINLMACLDVWYDEEAACVTEPCCPAEPTELAVCGA